jgi:hypothetical protein
LAAVAEQPRSLGPIQAGAKLVTIAFLMLKHNEPYRYAKPVLIAESFGNCITWELANGIHGTGNRRGHSMISTGLLVSPARSAPAICQWGASHARATKNPGLHKTDS